MQVGMIEENLVFVNDDAGQPKVCLILAYSASYIVIVLAQSDFWCFAQNPGHWSNFSLKNAPLHDKICHQPLSIILEVLRPLKA